ncbi:MAG: hypothetical protein WC516_08560 [Patescibacteria group bacterium]|jgi:hypothetical protein
MDKTESKYKVGQIVVLKSVKKEPPFRILSIQWNDGWFYQWNRDNFASEGMLRELTDIEKGVSNA